MIGLIFQLFSSETGGIPLRPDESEKKYFRSNGIEIRGWSGWHQPISLIIRCLIFSCGKLTATQSKRIVLH